MVRFVGRAAWFLTRRARSLKAPPRLPTVGYVTWVHECSFCGWSRPASGPTMLAPSCDRCGCVLEAWREGERHDLDVADVRVPGRRARLVGMLVLLAPVALAARVGFDHGGAGVAVLAVALTVVVLAGVGFRRA